MSNIFIRDKNGELILPTDIEITKIIKAIDNTQKQLKILNYKSNRTKKS
ncbi:hypothetical protein SSYRP_v1c06140 [Spiroplasma syrphidicola EA-1]|uniref:Uncharacterized protein n=1 Tax=Spiroplasma syrphidicola EA-1 TaxID=1276229 RepID=R4UE74_9MOLU|nr:hypothetical protein [Spiroplasma syrphidicola]AGM26204.1 hypothetical protein SSYRP_v1c06140 [Spiroplasma syrphidicola EA-1]